MALKPAEQSKLDMLNQTAAMLAGMNLDADAIREKMAPMIQSLEKDTNSKLVLVYTDGVPSFNAIDLRSDFIRTRPNTEGTMLSLRAKIVGIPLEIKVRKDADGLRASNAEVAESLLFLAEYVKNMPVEMVDADTADWPRELGSLPKRRSAGAEEGGDDDNNAPEVQTAPVDAGTQNPQAFDEDVQLPGGLVGEELE
jgi:hypothetical protein